MKKIWAFMLLFFAGFMLYGDVPVRKEQLIYTILAFNGKDYSPTFSGEFSDAIYLIAGVDNFLSVRKTLVYYWPITGEWKTDTESLNVLFEGRLELKTGGEDPRMLEQKKYTYYNIRGEYELNWKVDQGEKAEEAWARYQDILNAYWDSVQEYQKAKYVYDLMFQELIKKTGELREAGEDVSELLKNLETLHPPEQPEYPKEYIVPPVQVQEAFILNLPVGEYGIRLFTEEGAVMEDSERRVVVFNKRRDQGIGLEVIPGDRWTRPVESKRPASVLYMDGSTDIYLRPFFQQEYNDLFYEKLKKNDSRGNPNLMKWVRIQQVPEARIEVIGSDRNPVTVLEKPYYVEQVKGAALGYRIVPYDPEGAHKDRDPSLKAFHIAISRGERRIKLRVRDKMGNVLTGSERQIRIIRSPGTGTVLIVLALLPLLAMMIVRSRRSRKHTL